MTSKQREALDAVQAASEVFLTETDRLHDGMVKAFAEAERVGCTHQQIADNIKGREKPFARQRVSQLLAARKDQ